MALQKKEFNYGQILDLENNSYRSILITNKTLGTNQEWFADNLNVSKFRNGDIIQQSQNKEDWKKACENKQPAWCFFEDKTDLGKLYNIYAISVLSNQLLLLIVRNFLSVF